MALAPEFALLGARYLVCAHPLVQVDCTFGGDDVPTLASSNKFPQMLRRRGERHIDCRGAVAHRRAAHAPLMRQDAERVVVVFAGLLDFRLGLAFAKPREAELRSFARDRAAVRQRNGCWPGDTASRCTGSHDGFIVSLTPSGSHPLLLAVADGNRAVPDICRHFEIVVLDSFKGVSRQGISYTCMHFFLAAGTLCEHSADGGCLDAECAINHWA